MAFVKEKKATPEFNPNPLKCSLWIQRKQRFCSGNVHLPSTRCGMHPEENGLDGRKVIPCPLDARHFVLETHLVQHLKKCPGKAFFNKPVFYKAYCNSSIVGVVSELQPLSLKSLDTLQLNLFIKRILELGASFIEVVQTAMYDNAVIRKEIVDLSDNEAKNIANSGVNMKHFEQQSSLIGLMDFNKLLVPKACYIEFGAGKGKLLHFVHKALGYEVKSDFLAVDRANCRQKYDRYHSQNINARFERVHCDIEHLDLLQVPLVQGSDYPLISCSKHLCGAATDLSLTCLVNATRRKIAEDDVNETHKRTKLEPTREIAGAVIALCCHQLCTWDRYCNKKFFLDVLKLSEQDFHYMTLMSSWAVSSLRPEPRLSRTTGLHAELEETLEDTELASTTKRTGLSKSEQEHVGITCKRLLDMGRIHYLRENGLHACLQYYVASEYSIENVALVARTPAIAVP